MSRALCVVAIVLTGSIFQPLLLGATAEAQLLVTPLENVAPAIDPVRLAARVFEETNRVRREHGRSVLRKSQPLESAAGDQAGFMALTLECRHDNPVKGSRSPLERAQRVGLKPGLVGENAARVPVRALTEQDAAAYLVQVWMDSPGHRANLLSADFDYLGCAIRVARMPTGEDAFFAVQVFFHPARTVQLATAR